MKALSRATAVAVLLLVALPASSIAANPVTIDFSTHGQGPFDQSFYESDGVIFIQGSFVGYIQGDEALVGPVAGIFKPKVSSLSVRVAPANQGTAIYTLSALSSSGELVASTSVTVTQDEGDPANSVWGYFTLDLGPLPKKARSFTLTNTFVRSSFSLTTSIEFGVSVLSF